jgi:hypothetical protein
MRTQLTIEVEIEQLTCARCEKTALVEPTSIRAQERWRTGEAPWRVDSWYAPEGWERFEWPAGGRAASCPDCWPEIKQRAGMFLQLLRE